MSAIRSGNAAFGNDNELAELAYLRKEMERILTESLSRAWNEGTEKSETPELAQEVGLTVTDMVNQCWDEETENSATCDLTKEVGLMVTELTTKCWDEVSEFEDSDTFGTSESESSLLSGDEADVSTISDFGFDGPVRTAFIRPFAGEEVSPDELQLYRNTFELGWGDGGDVFSDDSSRYGAISGLEVDGEELDFYR